MIHHMTEACPVPAPHFDAAIIAEIYTLSDGTIDELAYLNATEIVAEDGCTCAEVGP